MGCPLTRLEPSTIVVLNSITIQIENPTENETRYFSPMNQTTNAVSFRNIQKLQEGTSTSLAFPMSTTYNTYAHFEPSPNADDDDEDEVAGLSCKVPNGKDFNKTKYPGAKTAPPNIKSQTIQDFDKSQLRELTSLNFSGLFTFRKHFQTSQEIFFKDYLFIEKIGKGGCGEAYKAFHKLTNQFRVIKKINKHSGYDSIKIDKLNQKLIYEAKLIAAMDHPNIVKVYEIFQDEDQVAIVLEYVEGKDLRQNLRNPLFDSNEAIATIIEQVLSGIVYLHMKGVTHKDIKAENIVLEEANPFSNLKLIDFGFSEIKHRQDTHNNAGTISYTAPEVLMRGNDKKCDLWCTGVLLYQLAFKELPFKGSTPSEIRDQILTKDLNELFDSPQARSKDPLLINLLRKLIARDLKKRYSAEEALNDPFIQKYARKPELEPSDFEIFKVYQKKTVMELVLSSVFVHNLMSREEKSNFIRIFRALDTKRRGFLSSDDFQTVDFSSSQEAVKAEISQKVQKGQLALTNMIISCVDLNDKDIIRKLFTYLDLDEDLFINLEDVYNVLEKYIDKNVLKEIKSQLKSLNKKQISYLDFRKLLKMF